MKQTEDKELARRINQRAWSLAHATHEDLRDRIRADPGVKSGRIPPEDWEPAETTQDVMEPLEVAAISLTGTGLLLRRRGRQLAGLVGKDFDRAVERYLSPEERAVRVR